MQKKYLYILVVLIISATNLMYLIVREQYKSFKEDMKTNNINKEITSAEARITEKNERLSYKQTNAAIDKSAKNELNRKNPWEEVIKINSEEEVASYKKIDTTEQILTTKKTKNLETMNMTNFEKWMYFIFKKDKS